VTVQLTADVTGLVIDALDGVAAVDSRMPANLETVVPFIRAQRVGGPDDGMALDDATIVLNCFAATDKAANLLGQAAVAAVRAARGVVTNGAVITHVRKLGGPGWADYENPNVSRVYVTLQVAVKST
jgi:hypothetical protein